MYHQINKNPPKWNDFEAFNMLQTISIHKLNILMNASYSKYINGGMKLAWKTIKVYKWTYVTQILRCAFHYKSREDLNSSRKLTRNSFKQCNFDENTNYANERSSVQYNEQWIPRTQQYNRYIPPRHHFLLEFGKRKSRLPLITLSTTRCTLYIVVVRGLLLETEGTCYYLECLYLPSIILMWM